MPAMDPVMHEGLSAAEAARAMTVPKGFTVKVAAAEPDIVRPIAFTLDDRGRLWVAEAHTYPVRAEGDKGRDRILIFEDTNGDGRLDSRKVFIEGLNLVSGLEYGFGGCSSARRRISSSSRSKKETDLPAGPPQVLLDGWGYQDTHEMLNTFYVGSGRLALRHARRVHELERGQARRSGLRAPAAERGRSGAITRRHGRSRCSPRARAIRGGSTSTTTATPSRRRA